MVFLWLLWSRGLLAASHGLCIAPSPWGSHGLIISQSRSLLAASHGLVVAPSPWSLCGLNLSRPPGLLMAIMVFVSLGGFYDLVVFSLPLMV